MALKALKYMLMSKIMLNLPDEVGLSLVIIICEDVGECRVCILAFPADAVVRVVVDSG